MGILNALRHRLAQLLHDRRGNFAVMTALLIPAGLATVGMAMDTNLMLATKARLQAAADSGALAAASALAEKEFTEEQAKQLALNFLKGQTSDLSTDMDDDGVADFSITDCSNVTVVTTTTVGTAKKFDVTVNTCFDVKLTSLSVWYGQNHTRVKVTSTSQSATETKNAMSMYLVLDRSGSMDSRTDTVESTYTYTYSCGTRYRPKTCTGTGYNYVTKINALKMAVTDLLNQLKTADPTNTFVRTGAVSYDSSMQTPTNLAWGTTAAQSYVNALSASGGTDSSEAFKTGYQAVTSGTEDSAHINKNHQIPSRYIVLMTDGDNNYTSADTATKSWCDAARSSEVEVYTVAFMAPQRGKDLLSYCATDSAHYFAAENTEDLIAAFKYIGERASKAASRLTN